MSKELVISAASHERRVAILEEGQLVEIYIEREKEFALVGSIYKGKVTRVLPGMQSAFVDIGLDGDAFLYVSDVFENLEDYDHDHGHETPHAAVATLEPLSSSAEQEMELRSVELLPGESLAKANAPTHEAGASEAHDESFTGIPDDEQARETASPAGVHEQEHAEEHLHPGNIHEYGTQDSQPDLPEERQPESNASAPQNFGPHYKSSNYPPRGGNARPGQNFGRGPDRGNDRGNDRGPDRGNDRGQDSGGGRSGRFGRRGGRRRGGRPGAPGGRNLPPSKYASPQGSSPAGESRGNENRGQGPNRGSHPRGFEPRGSEQRGFDNRRPETPRHGGSPSSTSNFDTGEEPILLPGESLAKYRGKPLVSSAAPVAEQESTGRPSEAPETSRQPAAGPATAQPSGAAGTAIPRRFTGGLPRWLLADAGAESEAAPVSAEENIGVADDATLSAHGSNPPRHEASPLELPDSSTTQASSTESEQLNDDQIAALASGIVEAKQEEVQEVAQVDALAGDAIFEEEEEVEEVEVEGQSEEEI
jgi:hypothetical protein